MQPTDERTGETGDERHRPVDAWTLLADDELGEGSDAHSETEDCEDQHGRER